MISVALDCYRFMDLPIKSRLVKPKCLHVKLDICEVLLLMLGLKDVFQQSCLSRAEEAAEKSDGHQVVPGLSFL